MKTQKVKNVRFKKVIKWGRLNLNGKVSFVFGFLMFIPILNIILGLTLISLAWDKREIYWEKIE